MSLIVARKYKDHFVLVGDTKLTYPSFDKNSPKDGLIKSVIVNPQLVISVAGIVEFGNIALQKVKDGIPKDQLLKVIQKIHETSEYKTEFLICFGLPDVELISIKQGETESVQVGWIGSHSAFDKFQNYYHNPEEVEELFNDVTTLKVIRLPDEIDEVGRGIYSKMFFSMNGVIEDPTITEVGGFTIPIIYEKGRFEYVSYGYVYRKPIDLDAEFPDGLGGIINFGGAEDGSFCVNFSGSLESKIAIHFYQGNLGVTYERNDNKLLYPKMYPNTDEIDFSDKILREDRLKLGFHIQHGLGNFAHKGITKLQEGRYQEGIELLNRGIRIASKDWEDPRNPNNEFINLSDFLEERGSAKIKPTEANNLMLSFFNRGLGYKRLDNHEMALLDFRQALTVDGDYIPALLEKGIAQFQLNQKLEAIITMTACIEKQPSDICFYNRGVLYLYLGKLNEAENDFKSSLEFNPNYQDSINALAEIERMKK